MLKKRHSFKVSHERAQSIRKALETDTYIYKFYRVKKTKESIKLSPHIFPPSRNPVTTTIFFLTGSTNQIAVEYKTSPILMVLIAVLVIPWIFSLLPGIGDNFFQIAIPAAMLFLLGKTIVDFNSEINSFKKRYYKLFSGEK